LVYTKTVSKTIWEVPYPLCRGVGCAAAKRNPWFRKMAATIKDIARAAGVSVTTVSRALAGYDDVAESTRIRVQETAKELNYRPNLTAQRLRKQRTDTLGFIIPTSSPRFTDPFFSELIAGIGNEAAAKDYDLLVSTHPPGSEDENNAYLRAVSGGWVDGLIVVRTREDDSRIKLLSQHKFPFVAFGRTDCGLDFPFVDEDSEAGTRLLVQHFINLGHQRIAFISPPKGLMFGRYRLKAFYETMNENGLEVHRNLVIEGDMTQYGGAECVERLLSGNPLPTAIIGGNDLMAIGAINKLQRRGYSVGKKIAVGGFDDIPSAEYVTPPLTTVHQPIYEIGRTTCAMLIDLINEKPLQNPHVMLTPALIVRDSSGPPML
jgi:LacI family transcriptional regulator